MKLSTLFLEAKKSFPDKLAVIDPGKQKKVTYGELASKVEKLRIELLKHFSSPPPLLGLCAPKSIQSLTALFALQQVGSAYVPLDAHGAIHRNLLILNDCRPNGILLSKEWAEIFSQHLSCEIKLISLQSAELFLLKCTWETEIELIQNLAFILYTSGSTGQPKGVQITHENAWAFISWANETFELGPEKICTSIAPFHFDLSVFDIYVSLSKGAVLLLIDQKSGKNPRLVAQWFFQYQVHTCYATPSFLKLLLKHGKLQKYDFHRLKQVLFAGEVFDIQSLRDLTSIWENATFFNLYGPTETNVVSYFQVPGRISPDQEQPFPIGTCCSGATAKIWNEGQLHELKKGLEGELAVSGPSVFSGYLGKTEKSSSSFVFNQNDQRFYLTGDWVEVGQLKNLIFRGRKDRMIKRRGYRIELAELERALSLHPFITEAACITDQGKVIAFCSSPSPNGFPDPIELNQFLKNHLPAYMLPDSYKLLDRLPQTSTQKIDYQRLKTT